MFDCARWILSALLIVSFCAAGCGEDTSSETSSSEGAPAAVDDAAAAGEDGATADETETADAEAAPPAEAPAGPVGLMKEVAIAPTATEAPPPSAFIFYSAKQAAPAVAEFHKKDLEAKGWKVSRNERKKLPGTTLSGAIQQYEKGTDVLTVILTEQLSDGPLTSVCVMDIPLPPTLSFLNPYGGQGSGEIGGSPADAIAWFTRELSARGWTADKPQETGGTHAINFRKGQRTLATQFRAIGADGKNSTFYFMHMG